jgi:hypothetical protein
MGPPPIDSAFGSDPVGEIGVHFPREIVRVERDFTVGDLVQYVSSASYFICHSRPMVDSIQHFRWSWKDG